MPPNLEQLDRRVIDRPVELRAAPDGASGPGILTGYGVVFNSPSRDLGGFTEIILPGAVKANPDGSLDLADHVRVMARTNHNSDYLLGTTDALTLRLFVDSVGVRYEIDLPDTTYGRDLAVSAGRGDIAHSSFAFRTPPGGDRWAYDHDDSLVRYVSALQLVDVAPVADPAYWGSTSELLRSFDLDAVRSALNPPALADGAKRIAIRARANEITIEMERGH